MLQSSSTFLVDSVPMSILSTFASDLLNHIAPLLLFAKSLSLHRGQIRALEYEEAVLDQSEVNV